MRNDCLFCGIADGDIPSERVHEDDQVVGFRDVNPQAPIHVLIIPREHVASAAELDLSHDTTWSRMLHVAQQVADSEGMTERGYRLVTNIGGHGGQTVSHLHLHLLGGRAMGWPPG